MGSNSTSARSAIASSVDGRDSLPSGGILFVPAASRERVAVRERLGRLGLPLTTVVNVTDALRLLASRSFALCLVDLADDRMALPSIRVVRAQHPHVPIGAIVDPSNPLVAGEALHLGAIDLLPWPFDGRDVTTLLANVADRQDMAPAVDVPGEPGAESLFAHSAPMRLVVDAVRRAADTTGGVCLCGEPGTGRTRVAQAIHAQSSRAPRRFITVDCAGVSPEELERRLFGLAIERRSQPRGPAVERIGPGGAIYEARGGTLYLSNVVEAPARIQARMARLLRDGEAHLVDGRETVDVDVRLMAGAEAALDAWVADGHLREDLFERLVALRIDVPPLRRRREDIPLLAVHFLRSACAGAGVPVKGLSRSAMALLSALPWPGNARDLRSLIETLMHAVGPSVIQLEDVLAHASLEGASARIDTGMTLRDARARFEHDCISAVLIKHHGRVGDAAKALGIQRTNLYRKVRQLNVARSLLAARR
jgi:two-component system nitrogen regulation response regulator NtrX